MTHSLINTSLFMNSNDNTDEIKYKGEKEQKNLQIYEKISNDEDIYLIKTDNGHSYKLYRKHLLDTLKELHKFSHLQTSKLNEEQNSLLSSTIEATRILYNTKALKDLVLKDIQDIFHIKNPIPGTIGAFFVGCLNNDDFTGPIGCNPRCAASLLNCDEHFNCSDTILILTENEFKSLNNKHTSHAYIYIEDSEFKDFKSYQISQLKDAGIQSITIIYSNEDGSYKEITNELHIDTFDCDNNSNIQAGWIVIIILIIILILFFLLYFYENNYNL